MRPRPTRTLTFEAPALALVLLLAVGLRFGALDWPPLGPGEASAALAALRLTPSAAALDPSAGPPASPAYGALTAMLFDAFGAGDALARAVPAVAGVGLLLTCLLLRPALGPGTAFLAALVLALSPALVLTSRTAGGAALSLTTLSLAWFVVTRADIDAPRRAAWASALLGAALASGPLTFTGLLGMALGQLLHSLLARSSSVGVLAALRSAGFTARRHLMILLGVLLALATGFGLERGAMAGAAVSLADWVRGWGQPASLGLGTALLSLAIYEPLIVLGALLALLRWRSLNDDARSLAMWGLGALLVALAYPGRGAAELAWCLIPLAVLAAHTLASAVERVAREEQRVFQATLAGLLMLLLVFAYLQLSAYVRGIGRGPAYDPALDLGLAIGAFVLATVVTVLFGLGWSWSMALGGVQAVALLAALAVSVSGLTAVNFARSAATARELWRVQAATVESRLLATTAEGVSTGQTGSPDALPLRLEAAASPVLAWTLRGFPRDAATDARSHDLPRLILRPQGAPELALAADYIGQTFTIAERKGWTGLLPSGLLAYLVRREAPVTPQAWLLLVRADIASFGELPAQPAPAGPDS
jgi:hypothetical protein